MDEIVLGHNTIAVHVQRRNNRLHFFSVVHVDTQLFEHFDELTHRDRAIAILVVVRKYIRHIPLRQTCHGFVRFFLCCMTLLAVGRPMMSWHVDRCIRVGRVGAVKYGNTRVDIHRLLRIMNVHAVARKSAIVRQIIDRVQTLETLIAMSWIQMRRAIVLASIRSLLLLLLLFFGLQSTVRNRCHYSRMFRRRRHFGCLVLILGQRFILRCHRLVIIEFVVVIIVINNNFVSFIIPTIVAVTCTLFLRLFRRTLADIRVR
mmetsp:Transcript_55294/g.91829  ORF Transcript_55294/g.91829 Transcript_55294/m.91829 type:complete len:260 (-) Transcript_55294:870-1649(-)